MCQVLRRNAHHGGVLLAMGLAACAPGSRIPINDRVSLRYDGASDSGAAFILDNGSRQSIQFRGESYSWIRTEPVEPINASWACKVAGSAASGDEPYVFGDGAYTVIKVPPGRRLRLSVNRPILSDYKDGQCHLRLRLEGGTDIISNDFEPSPALRYAPTYNDLSRRKPGE
jgi:hypothetical protein